MYLRFVKIFCNFDTIINRSIEGIIFVQLGEMEEGVGGHSARSYTNICI